jgi:hypothetical protein
VDISVEGLRRFVEIVQVGTVSRRVLLSHRVKVSIFSVRDFVMGVQKN